MAANNYRGYVQHSSFFQMLRNQKNGFCQKSCENTKDFLTSDFKMAAKNYRGYVQHSSFFQMKRNWQNLKVKQKILGSDTRLDTMSAFEGPPAQDRVNPRNPGYILQRQTLGGYDSIPPLWTTPFGFFRAFFLYHSWDIYKWGAHAKNWVTYFHILVGGPPRTFRFWACLIWPSDSWQNLGFTQKKSKSL